MDWRFKLSIGFMLLLIASVFMLSSETPIIDPLLSFFLYSIPSNAAISIFPHEPVLIFLGRTYEPLLLAIIATLGTLIAGVLDYYVYVPMLSHKMIQSIHSSESFVKITKWFNRKPFISIVLAGMTPLPFFPFKIIAFSTKYPLHKYLSALLVGRFPRYFLLAYLGEALQVPGWISITAFLVMVPLLLIIGLPILNDLFFWRSKERSVESTIFGSTNNGVKTKCNSDM